MKRGILRKSLLSSLVGIALLTIGARQGLACLTFELTTSTGAAKHGPGGGAGTLKVTTSSQYCSWSLNAVTETWIRASRSGSTINYTVDANPGPQSRKVTLRFSATSLPPPFNRPYDYQYTLDIVQDGTSRPRCPLTVASRSMTTGPDADDSVSSLVTTESYCEWQSSSDASWATVTKPVRLGTGPVSLAVAANPDGEERVAKITVILRDLDINGNPPQPIVIDLVQSGGPAQYSVRRSGGAVYRSTGQGDLRVGSATLFSASTLAPPSSLAIFGYHNNGVLISEASVPASRGMTAGRIPAIMDGKVNTGLALANTSVKSAGVTITFTDSNGQAVATKQFSMAPKAQVAAFLNESPFEGQKAFRGTLTFRTTVPVAAIALRGLSNERSEFLITTLPVADIAENVTGVPIVFPHYAEGAGWTSQIILVNPGGAAISGTVYVEPNASAEAVYSYSIPAGGMFELRPQATPNKLSTGWVAVLPAAGTTSPDGVVIFSYKNAAGITVSEAGVQAFTLRSPIFDTYALYVEGEPLSVQTGFAVVNLDTDVADVTVELHDIAGRFIATRKLSVPALGQKAQFVNEIFDAAELRGTFKGVLRISGPVAIAGLRFRTNERGDQIYTTLPAIQHRSANFRDIYLPHVVDGAGYSTQFVLLETNSTFVGEIQFNSQKGEVLSMPIRPQP